MGAEDSPRSSDVPSPSELAVLALLLERPRHGWSLAVLLSHGGEVGAIWSVARPLVYTSLRRLEELGLARAAGIEPGERGPHRVVYKPTAKGRRTIEAWLAVPVERVREIRSLFLLKVVLSQRLGVDPTPLLRAQRAVVSPFVTFLEAGLEDVEPLADQGEATVVRFRLASAQAMLGFIDRMLDVPPPRGAAPGRVGGPSGGARRLL